MRITKSLIDPATVFRADTDWATTGHWGARIGALKNTRESIIAKLGPEWERMAQESRVLNDMARRVGHCSPYQHTLELREIYDEKADRLNLCRRLESVHDGGRHIYVREQYYRVLGNGLQAWSDGDYSTPVLFTPKDDRHNVVSLIMPVRK